MDIHKNARLSFRSRELLVQQVVEDACTLKAAAAAFRVTAKTAAKWVQRYRVQGSAGLYRHPPFVMGFVSHPPAERAVGQD